MSWQPVTQLIERVQSYPLRITPAEIANSSPQHHLFADLHELRALGLRVLPQLGRAKSSELSHSGERAPGRVGVERRKNEPDRCSVELCRHAPALQMQRLGPQASEVP